LTKSEIKKAEKVLLESGVGDEVAQTMYTHVSKCKNNKIQKKEGVLSHCTDVTPLRSIAYLID
jgi:hypothetical protein